MKHGFLKILIVFLLALSLTLPMLACDGGNGGGSTDSTTLADTTAST